MPAPFGPGVEPSPESQVDFAGWGTVEVLDNLSKGPIRVTRLDSGQSHKLGEFAPTRTFRAHAGRK